MPVSTQHMNAHIINSLYYNPWAELSSSCLPARKSATSPGLFSSLASSPFQPKLYAGISEEVPERHEAPSSIDRKEASINQLSLQLDVLKRGNDELRQQNSQLRQSLNEFRSYIHRKITLHKQQQELQDQELENLRQRLKALSVEPSSVTSQLMRSAPTFALHTNNGDSTATEINKPKAFSGLQDEYDGFIDSCRIYITANWRQYESDDNKIMLILSYMQEGHAARWRHWYLTSFGNGDWTINHPPFKDFLKWLDKSFIPAAKPINTTTQTASDPEASWSGRTVRSSVYTSFYGYQRYEVETTL